MSLIERLMEKLEGDHGPREGRRDRSKARFDLAETRVAALEEPSQSNPASTAVELPRMDPPGPLQAEATEPLSDSPAIASRRPEPLQTKTGVESGLGAATGARSSADVAESALPPEAVLDDAWGAAIAADQAAQIAPDSQRAGPALKPAEDSAGGYVELDLERLQLMGMVVPTASPAAIAEEYRLIKRPLLQNISVQGQSGLEHPNLIMVTSALPGEGKTFTAVNLAMSMVMEMDHTVLLVDADIPKPSLQRVLGVEAERGLIDVLLGDAELPEVLLRTNLSKLRLLPAGRRHSHSVELLASEAMRNLVRHISERYPDRIVIFDSPPLLVTSEAGILADLMSQIVLVVQANQTPQEAVKEAVSQIDESKYIGLVLNKAEETARHAARYRYPYAYRYGH